MGCDIFIVGLWGVVNNAVMHIAGAAEVMTMNQYSNLINVNLFGTIRVTKAFLPLIRATKGKSREWHKTDSGPENRRGNGLKG